MHILFSIDDSVSLKFLLTIGIYRLNTTNVMKPVIVIASLKPIHIAMTINVIHHYKELKNDVIYIANMNETI